MRDLTIQIGLYIVNQENKFEEHHHQTHSEFDDYIRRYKLQMTEHTQDLSTMLPQLVQTPLKGMNKLFAHLDKLG